VLASHATHCLGCLLLPASLVNQINSPRLVSSPSASAPHRHATPRAPPTRPPRSPKSLSPAGPRSRARGASLRSRIDRPGPGPSPHTTGRRLDSIGGPAGKRGLDRGGGPDAPPPGPSGGFGGGMSRRGPARSRQPPWTPPRARPSSSTTARGNRPIPPSLSPARSLSSPTSWSLGAQCCLPYRCAILVRARGFSSLAARD